MDNQIKKKLTELSDPVYRSFQEKLIPGGGKIIGVRMPAMHALAKRIAAGDPEAFFATVGDDSHEEIMLQGLVTACLDITVEERMTRLAAFVPKINNWSICDTCCARYHFIREEKELWFEWLKKYISSTDTYELRFGIVCLLMYYREQGFLPYVFSVCEENLNKDYYVQMAKAWILSAWYPSFPQEIGDFLKTDRMDKFTHNKAIQKIRESYQVSIPDKDWLNTLKRK